MKKKLRIISFDQYGVTTKNPTLEELQIALNRFNGVQLRALDELNHWAPMTPNMMTRQGKINNLLTLIKIEEGKH